MTHNRIRMTFTVGGLLAWIAWLSAAALAVLVGLDYVPIRWGFGTVVLAAAALGLTIDRLLERLAKRELDAYNLGQKTALKMVAREGQ